MPKILIVEDERQLVEYIKPSLEKRGYSVISAFSGKEALESFSKENPDLVLLDLGLPDMNGSDVLKGIKLKAPQSKIIVISGYTDPDTKRELMELGADEFLNKPILPMKIYELLEKFLNKTT